ncbi:unnamed protein product [Sphagnum tenellum]
MTNADNGNNDDIPYRFKIPFSDNVIVKDQRNVECSLDRVSRKTEAVDILNIEGISFTNEEDMEKEVSSEQTKEHNRALQNSESVALCVRSENENDLRDSEEQCNKDSCKDGDIGDTNFDESAEVNDDEKYLFG